MNTAGRPPAPTFQVKLNWKIALFSVLLLPFLTGLGFWQLQRAEEKRTIQESWRAQQALPPVSLEEIDLASGTAFRRVSLAGRFDAEHYWLMENRMLDGQLGYEVLMPFLSDAEVVIINRGWLPAGAYRADLPAVATPSEALRISGTLIEPSANPLLNESGHAPTVWPARILQAELELLGAQLAGAGYQQMPYPRLLQIDAESPGAFHTNWQPINMSPATHHGYAVQWFTMAVALLILAVFANTNLADVLVRRVRPQQK